MPNDEKFIKPNILEVGGGFQIFRLEVDTTTDTHSFLVELLPVGEFISVDDMSWIIGQARQAMIRSLSGMESPQVEIVRFMPSRRHSDRSMAMNFAYAKVRPGK